MGMHSKTFYNKITEKVITLEPQRVYSQFL
jgi:hypothetical protein